MRAIIFMPRYIAMSTCGVIFLWMLNADYGIINVTLRKMGLQGVPWLEDRRHGHGIRAGAYRLARRGLRHDDLSVGHAGHLPRLL